MIAISLPTQKANTSTISFTSTLYLYPILDLLLANVPPEWQPDLRLGLQEALVNAAKHGNNLDPTKTVVVKFSATKEGYCWVISNEGNGFTPKCNCENGREFPPEEEEHGRGLCILHEVFDRVHWNSKGTQLRLSKAFKNKPILS